MHMHIEASEQFWNQVIEELIGEIPVLVDDFLGLLQHRGLYEDGQVPPADLEHTAHEMFQVLLEQLSGRPTTHHRQHHQDTAVRLAQRRARQDVQIDTLMAAVRLDFIIIWRRLRQLIPESNIDLLVDRTEQILTVVEGYIGQVQLEFIAETARLAHDARLATERHLSRLLNIHQLSTVSLEHIATGLRVDRDGAFEVAVSTDDSVGALQNAAADELAEGSVLGYTYRSRFCLIRQQQRNEPPLQQLYPEVPAAHATGIEGLSAIRPGVEGMVQMLSAADAVVEMISVDRLWPAAASAHLSTLIPGFPHRHVRGLRALPGRERREVLEAVEHYLDTGSIKLTAEALHCHRNTVINRLSAFSGATGLDARIPKQAALALIATSDGHLHTDED